MNRAQHHAIMMLVSTLMICCSTAFAASDAPAAPLVIE
jgi:hypothetical protein